MSGLVTTAKVVCCANCGAVFGTEGSYSVSPSWCGSNGQSKHAVIFVLVVVPLG